MENFICRVCGGGKYHHIYDVIPDLYFCSNCSAIFAYPESFSIPPIKFTRFSENAKTPQRAHSTDTGYDLFSVEEKVIPPYSREMVKTDVAFEFPEGFGFQIRAKSGLAKKKGVTVLNSPATIDQGYRDQVGVIIQNNTIDKFEIEQGDKIAQFVLERTLSVNLVEVSNEEFNMDTDRGIKGYGDTGRK